MVTASLSLSLSLSLATSPALSPSLARGSGEMLPMRTQRHGVGSGSDEQSRIVCRGRHSPLSAVTGNIHYGASPARNH